MQPPPDIESLSYKDRVILAVQLVKSNASLSLRHVASMYNVSQNTINNQRAGMHSQRNTYPTQSNLTKSEEDSLVLHIRDLSLHRFTPCHAKVRSIADQLLAIHSGTSVSNN
jgi:hypothetical protein